MTLGTGIFLSSILFSLIILFGLTKDRWNWKKIFVRFSIASIGLCLVIAAGLWGYGKYQNRIIPPKPQEQLGLLKLSHTKSDVKFLMGEPDLIKNNVWFYKNRDKSKIYRSVRFEGEHIWLIENFEAGLVSWMDFDKNAVDISGLGIGRTRYDEILQRYGKDRAKSRLAVDPIEAGIVRRIYAKYVAGAGAKAIANEFNQERLLRRGRRWTKNNILAIIGDESYVGRYYFNKTTGRQKKPNPRSEWILIPVDPIIDEPTWERAKTLKQSRNLVTNQVTPSAITTKTLLTGIAKCGLCGASFALETAKSGRYTYYNRSSYFRKGKATCPGQRIAADKLESAVLDHLTRRLFTRDRLKKLLAGVYQQCRGAGKKADATRNRLTAQLNEVKHRLTRQYEAIESGALELELVAERIRDLKDQKETLECSLERLNRPNHPPPHLFQDESIERFREIVDSAFRNGSNRRTVKRYVRLFVDRITIRLPVVEIEANTRGMLAAIENKKAVRTGVPTASVSWLLG